MRSKDTQKKVMLRPCLKKISKQQTTLHFSNQYTSFTNINYGLIMSWAVLGTMMICQGIPSPIEIIEVKKRKPTLIQATALEKCKPKHII